MQQSSKAIGEFCNPSLPLGIIALDSAKELGDKIDNYLVNWYSGAAKVFCKELGKDKNTFKINVVCPRFSSGDGKAVISETVRGFDLYLLVDVGNYNCTYNMYGQKVPMSPDDHFADLKRVIGAVGGKAQRITVIMPQLYGGRQHRRKARESLDCAVALQELERMGVTNVISFDAHDPRVQNAVPLMGLDNVMPTYQVLKALLRAYPDLDLSADKFMIVSPDEGAMDRNIYYASVLGVNLGMFYKRRDYSRVVDGRNPIVAHEYLGNSVEGKDIFVADDVISSGESMLSLARDLKKSNANRIFITATYALFTNGLEQFQKAYDDGLITGVFATNLTYIRDDLKNKPWFHTVDCSKYISYIIAAIHQNKSTSSLLDPNKKINELLKNYHNNK